MSDHRAKLRYAVELAVCEICRTAKHPTFDTFTFAENLTDKREAARRWRRLKARLKRHYPGLRGVGVWQRQERGAWHLHYLFDRFLPIVLVREWAQVCGFGPMLNMRPVKEAPGFRAWTIQRVARYVSRYITREVSKGEPCVRLVDYTGDSREATTAFRWAHGLGYLWRQGRQVWSDIHGGFALPTFEDFWFVVRLGWEILSEDEKANALATSDAVAKWWYPERNPF